MSRYPVKARTAENHPMVAGRRVFRCLAAVLMALACCHTAVAQQLAPRAYWPAPVGSNVFLAGFQRSTGDIVTDPTLPVTGVQTTINNLTFGYQRFFNFFGRTGSLQVSAPYTRGHTEGLVRETSRSIDVNGMGDMTIRAAINLTGAPAMDPDGMQELLANPRTITGLSLTASLPTGSYDADRLLNVGANRWALKPAAGLIWPVYPSWLLEMEAGVWVFGDNGDFLGQKRKQDQIWSGEMHLIKLFNRGFWMSLDINYYHGGRTSTSGTRGENLQRNARAGTTFVFPIRKGFALKLGYSLGVTTKSGGDYKLYTLQGLFAWR